MDAMHEDGLDDEEIEGELYYRPAFFKAFVDRCILPPQLLYWRVRAVFSVFGKIVDKKSGKPLFHKEAWKKANGVLKLILTGHISDPPGFAFYTVKLNPKGEPMQNMYGFEILNCLRGTNDAESVHKSLVTIFGTWHTGIEMSDCLLRERRHRRNQKCSERRRLGFP
jgi:hypothetical protein